MSTRQIAFAIQGMFCAKCAVDIERTLTRVDGVVAAQVNYATERAAVTYEPRRVPAAKIVAAIRAIGFDTPLERRTVYSDDLIYAPSAHVVEQVLRQAEGVVEVTVDLILRQVTLAVFPDYTNRAIENALARLGVRLVESPASDALPKFTVRALTILGFEGLAGLSAGAHAGALSFAGVIHPPVVVMALSMLALLGAGLPFYVFAYDAASQGIFDISVVTAWLAIVSAIASLPLAMVSPAPWLTDAGFVVTTTLTAGWFLVRAIQILRRQLHEATVRKQDVTTAPQPQLGVIPDGSRH